jgi:hypothetical protein
MPELTICSTCGAPIEWARFKVTGKRHPLDIPPAVDGTLQVVGADPDGTPVIRLMPVAERREHDGLLRRTHFATCPDADRHRRPR